MSCRKTFKEVDFELFEEPERLIVSGNSGAGKSQLVYNLLEKYYNKFDKILLSGGDLSFYEKLPPHISANIEFYEDVIDPFQFVTRNGHKVLYICDDLQDEVFKSKHISKAFRTGRHFNLSLILLTQSIFARQPYFRDITLNVTGIILLKSRDLNSVEILLRQIYGKLHAKNALAAYIKATSTPYGHILFDLKITTPIELSVRSNILKSQFPYITVHDIQ